MSLQTSTSFMPEKTENPKRKCPEDAGYGDYADRPYRFFSFCVTTRQPLRPGFK